MNSPEPPRGIRAWLRWRLRPLAERDPLRHSHETEKKRKRTIARLGLPDYPLAYEKWREEQDRRNGDA